MTAPNKLLLRSRCFRCIQDPFSRGLDIAFILGLHIKLLQDTLSFFKTRRAFTRHDGLDISLIFSIHFELLQDTATKPHIKSPTTKPNIKKSLGFHYSYPSRTPLGLLICSMLLSFFATLATGSWSPWMTCLGRTSRGEGGTVGFRQLEMEASHDTPLWGVDWLKARHTILRSSQLDALHGRPGPSPDVWSLWCTRKPL